jgi:DivIVA domain-containing protein
MVRVALERQSIEKKDFPIGRRGYDPEAVDTHLRSLADEVDELKRSSRRRSETLASSASEQVRAIVEAAENSAAEIQRQAEEEAQDIRSEASSEAQATREQATAQARDYVGKVSESTSVMQQRLDAMESELGALIESLRTGSNRLNADLQLLEGNLGEVSEAVSPRPRFEPEAPGSFAEEPEGVPEADLFEEQATTQAGNAAPSYDEPIAEAEPDHLPEPEGPHEPEYEPEPMPATPQAAEPTDGEDDSEGARLIALNMALNGTPREETDRYLAENFHLADRDRLLDEVYASVEG